MTNLQRGCYTNIENIFLELEECRPFELLRTVHDRGLYLLTRQARARTLSSPLRSALPVPPYLCAWVDTTCASATGLRRD